MAEIKKAQAAGFAEDSNAFAGGSSVKGTAAPKRHSRSSPAYTSREMQTTLPDRMSKGRDRRKLLDRMSKSRQKHLTAGRQKAGRESSTGSRVLLGRVTKCLKMRMPEVRRKVILQRKTVPLRRTMAQRRKKGSPAMITAAGTPIIRQRKGGITAGGNSVSIRTGNGRKPLILNRISIQKTMPLQREKKRSFRAAKSWISYRRKRRKPEERQKRQDGSCQRKRSIPLSVSLMKRQAGQSMC